MKWCVLVDSEAKIGEIIKMGTFEKWGIWLTWSPGSAATDQNDDISASSKSNLRSIIHSRPTFVEITRAALGL